MTLIKTSIIHLIFQRQENIFAVGKLILLYYIIVIKCNSIIMRNYHKSTYSGQYLNHTKSVTVMSASVKMV